jgi:hypothetical protein
MPLRFFALFALLASGGVAASASLEFSAYLHAADREHFVLRDLATGKNSGCLPSGEPFGGYTIGPFDPKTESLTVAKAGETFILPLKTAKVQTVEARGETVADLARQLEAARQELTKLRLRYREAAPAIVEQARKITELERQLAEQKAKN